MKEKYVVWYASQIPAGLEEGLTVDEIDVETPHFFVCFPRLFNFYYGIIIFNKLIFGSWRQLTYLW